MMDRLTARLADLAAQGQTITYGDLARELDIPAPGSIGKLTAALELLMQQDAADNLPFRAAVCAGRLGDGMPSLGFFEVAAMLDANMTADPQVFVAQQRAALQAHYGAENQITAI
jgi:hypothetical protein